MAALGFSSIGMRPLGLAFDPVLSLASRGGNVEND
jgi:hypothetical protein